MIRAIRQEIPVWGLKEIGAVLESLGLKGSPTSVRTIFAPPPRKGGQVLDTSEDGASMEFKVGDGELLKACEQAVIGMAVVETKTILIPAAEAYGLRKDEMVFEYDRSRAPENFDAEIGQQLQMYRADGQPVNLTHPTGCSPGPPNSCPTNPMP